MSSNENDQAEAAGEQQQFEIQKIYIKDISLEVPHTPQVYVQKWEPEMNVQINTGARPIENEPGLYETVLSITVTAKNQGENAFLVEIEQAGVFYINGFSEQDMGPMLGSFCPNILFPYAREAISDLVSHGGFPQVLLAPVNFDALYAEHQKQQASATEAEPETTH